MEGKADARLAGLMADAHSINPTEKYTFKDVQEDHGIEAVFEKETREIDVLENEKLLPNTER